MSLNTTLYEVAVILIIHPKDADVEQTLLLPPTPIMADGEKAAEYQALFLAKLEDNNLNVNNVKVLVRPFK